MNKTHLTTHKFADFALAPQVLDALNAQGFGYCTPIQAQCLPLALAGKDIAGQAQTGTGKTLAFLTATFHHLLTHEPRGSGQPRAIIMAPTRELAVQIHQDAKMLAEKAGLRLGLIYGGEGSRETTLAKPLTTPSKARETHRTQARARSMGKRRRVGEVRR